ncbi:hypothetical protein BGX31_004386 [Mortierella sp. GBA43]|nr:hypothetical protein BGX31_004386 [Mortierella sp. GBA43]
MLLRSIVPSPKGALSLQEILQLTDIYLENAIRANDNNVVLVLCHNAEVALSQAKNPFKKSSSNSEDRDSRLVAAAYFDLGKLLEGQGHQEGAQALYKRCKKWGGHDPMSSGKSIRPLSIIGSNKRVDTGATLVAVDHLSQEVPFSQPTQGNNYASVSEDIFPKNLALPNFEFKPPEPDSRLTDTPQLARCLGLLQAPFGPNDVTDTVIQNWLQVVKSEPEEHDRLKTLATDVIRAFKRDEFKNAKAVTEVVYLAPILEKDDFRYLLKEFHYGIEKSSLLDVHQLEGLAQLIQGAESNFLDADDLVKVLDLFSTRLRTTHQQSVHHIYQLTLAVANVLDAMADANVKGLDRETIHAPLLSYLDGLKGSSDPYLVYQAAYAYQALLYVPDNESIWQATLRRTGKVVKGISGLVSAMKSLDLNTFIESLGNIQQGLESASDVLQIVKNAYDQVSTLAKGGQSFLECLKEGLSFSRKCAWYPALRGADTMIQDGQFAEFKNLVCEAPCRRDAAFQWGVCQRLGQVAANTMWDGDTRQSAIAFLGEIYRNDTEWGQQATVKQWILDILMQLTVQSGEKMNGTANTSHTILYCMTANDIGVI